MTDNARKWVEALRSGEYDQTTGSLRNGDAYCCLGIACMLYHADTGNGKWIKGDDFEANGYEGDGVLPAPVAAWLGLTVSEVRHGSAAEFGSGSWRSCLSAENDNGKSFDQIADIIESEPPGLFR